MSFGISIGDLIKLGEVAGRVYKNCRDCTGDYKSLTTEARSLTNLLDDIQDKYNKIPPHRRKQLIDAYNPCIDVLWELDKLLQHYNTLDTRSKRAWDRLKWDPEKSRSLRERLASSVAMLNAFYTSLVHDNQVLILEALERLEEDYKGGFREESIASIERIIATNSQVNEDDDDAAWIQVIRDLEDVGISHQVALTYHDFVVDWFIRAVNEGRLLEERREPESRDSTRRSSGIALDVTSLSAPLAAVQLSCKTNNPHLEDSSTCKPPNGITLLQRSDSSNAPEPLHILETSAEIPKILHSPVSSYDELEPAQTLSPSLRAPGPLPVSDQQNKPDLRQPAIPASEASESVTSLTSVDLNTRAQQIIAAWTRHDFTTVVHLLEEQLVAVEQGFVTSTGLQPDRRVLRHCLGVCASFSGDFTKAKYFFESAFNGIYLIRDLDDGDIAAARWLGDICLQLRQFHNTVLAWSVALEGSIRRYGLSHDRTRHIIQEMYKLDEWVSAFGNINKQFLANVDPTDVFSNTHTLEKSDLVRAVQARVHESQPRWSQNKRNRPTATYRPRPRVELVPGEAFLTGPLVSSEAWPLQWDSTFSPMAVYQMEWYLKIAKPSIALNNRTLRTKSLGESKKLDYVTKGGSTWLIETVKAILRELGIEYAEHPEENAIVCGLNRDRDGFACSEGILISLWKLQFRNVFGLKISDVRWSTREPPMIKKISSLKELDPANATVEFRNIVLKMLELAEAGAGNRALTGDGTGTKFSTRSWATWSSTKRASASS